MTNDNLMHVEELTFQSVLLRPRFEQTYLSHATGFIVEQGEKLYLISNRHVLTGRDPKTENPLHSQAAVPDSITVYYHQAGNPGRFLPITEELSPNGGLSHFLLHPNPKVDVAVLPIKRQPSVDYHTTDHRHDTATNALITVATTVCIIGFPFGLSSYEYFPIWKTGSIASEVELPFGNLPCFLVDAATRGGMSGAPVYAVFRGPYPLESGGISLSQQASRFMGIYSGRLTIPTEASDRMSTSEMNNAQTLGSDLGMVWRPRTIDEILAQATEVT